MSFLAELEKRIPMAVAVVIGVEQAIHAQPGATKLGVAVNVLQTLTGIAATDENKDAAGAATLVSQIVATLNAAGVFSHGAPPTLPAAILAPVAVSPAS